MSDLIDRYARKARVERIIDGDTVDVEIDLGFDLVFRQRLRLFGVDTPELRGEERSRGIAARKFVVAWMDSADFLATQESTPTDADWPLVIRTIKDQRGKYGRLLARLYRGDGEELCQKLLDTGNAVKRWGS